MANCETNEHKWVMVEFTLKCPQCLGTGIDLRITCQNCQGKGIVKRIQEVSIKYRRA